MKRKICVLLLCSICLLVWGQDSTTVLDMRDGLPENRIRSICQLADGRIAIATTATVEVYDGTRFRSILLPPQKAYPLPDYAGARQMTCDTLDHIFLRNDHTLYVIDIRHNEVVDNVGLLLKRLQLTDADISKWPVSPMYTGDTTALLHDCYGGKWLCTKENGILYTNARRARQFTTTADSFVYQRLPNFVSPQSSLLSTRYAPSATNCTLDTDEYSYLGTRNGIFIINRNSDLVAIINKDYGLQTNNIAALLADNNGDVWAATASGGITRLHILGRDSFSIVNYGKPDGIRTDNQEFRTCQMHCDAVSGLFTVGFVGGTVRFHPDSITAPRYTFRFPAIKESSESNRTNILYILSASGLIVIVTAILFLRRKRSKSLTKPAVRQAAACPGPLTDPTEQMPVIEKIAPLSGNEIFLSKLKNTIEQHLDDENFSVQLLSELMAMDRTVLYRRMQQLTGIAPSVYIKQIRMEKAKKLLCETEMSISDIAMKTGFSTTKYFSSSFKEMTGMSPKTFREKTKG